jgi:AcrR family transcriptional regulator
MICDPPAVSTPARRMSAEDRREQLLDVLAEIVVGEGYGAVSIDRVARDAEIARTVVYAQFGNLEGMVEALVERTERRVLSQVRGLVPDLPRVSGDPDEILVEAVRAFTTLVRDDPRTWRVALFPAEGAPAGLRRRIAGARDAVLTLLEPVVAWGVEQRGGPAGLDTELFARTLVMLGEDAARLVLTDPDRYPPERLAGYAATLIAALARGPGA